MSRLFVSLALLQSISAVSHVFDFQITRKDVEIAPGLARTKTVVNGQFPGPLIRIPYGSELQIKIDNDLKDAGTSIHWHGIRQLGTPYYDGFAGQSQCPIPPGQSMTYNFKADPSGSTFWHAHFHSENVDGLFGPLVVEDEPESFPFQYDYEHVILMTDTYNKTSWALEESIFTAAEPPSPDPTPSEGLICVYDETAIPATPSCSSTVSGEGFNLNFEPGKIYRLRLICAADLAPFLFSIDEHELQVVSADYFTLDGTAWVNAVPIQTGQRYDVLVRAREDVREGATFWIRASMQPQCWPLLGELNADVRGTVKYGKGLPASPPESTSWNATNAACVDLDYSILKPSPTPFVSPIQKPALTTYLNYTFPTTVNGVARTFVNNNLYNVSDDAYPTLFQFNEDPSWRPNKPGENRNLIIIPDDIRGKDVRILVHSSGFPGTHPFHAHGGGFKVVAFGTGNFTDEDLGRVDEIDVRQVIERDTVIVPSLGWVMIQYTANNPGVWALHCHVGWHLQNGMLAQIVELPGVIASEITIPTSLKQTCSRNS